MNLDDIRRVARREAQRAAVATLLRLRESAVADGRDHVTVADIDRLVERIAAERAAAIEAERTLPSSVQCATPRVPEIDQRTAGVIVAADGRLIGDIARLTPEAERWGVRFRDDVEPPVPTERQNGRRWWADIAGVVAFDDPADVRRLFDAAVRPDEEDASRA